MADPAPAPERAAPKVLANDFAAQWTEISAEALAAVDRVGRSGWLVLGEEVAAFEREIASWWGIPYAVGVASGLDALEIALRCAGVGPGDRVLTTPLTAFATTLAVLRAGAEPVWVDVDETGALDLELAAAALLADPAIKAIIPVHLYGHPLDPVALAALAADYGVTLIEDCAQSAGAERDGRPTGLAGRIAATSLYPTKNLGAMGDGGVLLTADEDIAVHARTLRNYGQDRRYHHVELGLNSRLDELHAAMLRSALLPRLDRWLARRAEVAARYAEALDGSSLRPIVAAAGRSAHHLFPVEVLDGAVDAHAAQLSAAGIGVGRHYPFLCPDMPACAGVGVTIGELPVARRLAARELSLPLHPQLDDAAVEHVVAACRALSA
jgi:dTDP-3-amino-3,4,6-trideoxy-alpha-D-glucose transaminase